MKVLIGEELELLETNYLFIDWINLKYGQVRHPYLLSNI